MRKGMEWDQWYHELCMTVAKKSQCLSRQIGAILVKDKAVVSQGYCGPPRGVRTCDERWFVDVKMRKTAGFKDDFINFYSSKLEGVCPRYVPEMGFKSGEGLDWCVSSHAERNALINAARAGIATKGTIMYMDCEIPCKNCLAEIINSGVKEIVITKVEYYDISSKYLLEQSKLKYRVYDHLKG